MTVHAAPHQTVSVGAAAPGGSLPAVLLRFDLMRTDEGPERDVPVVHVLGCTDAELGAFEVELLAAELEAAAAKLRILRAQMGVS